MQKRLTTHAAAVYALKMKCICSCVKEILLIAGGNGLYGTVPSSWGQMAALQDLELDYNCGLCGNLPTLPMQVCQSHLIWYCTCSLAVAS